MKSNTTSHKITALGLCLLLFGAAAYAGTADPLCEQAAHLFFNRHLAKNNLDSAYSLLRRARSLEPKHEYCLYLWSRIHIQKGDDAPRADKIGLYEKSKAIAETLKTLNPANPDGHMWWGAAQGRIGQTRGVMNSLFMVPSLKRAFNKTLELDSAHAVAYNALGVLYYELPGIAGGSLAKSEEYLGKGLRFDPNYTIIRLDLAKVLIRQRRWKEARDQLSKLITTDNPTCPADFVLDDRPEAEKLLKQIADK